MEKDRARQELRALLAARAPASRRCPAMSSSRR